MPLPLVSFAMRKFSNQRGPEAHHSALKRVQAHFGFTQQELADVLGVSRAALTMAASNRRSLSSEAGRRLLQFQLALPVTAPDAAPTAAPILPALADDDRQDLDLRRRSLTLQAQLLDQPLARHQTRLAQARLRLQVLPGLRASFPADDELAQALFNLWHREANATLRHEPGPMARLALRQAVLAFEAAEIAKLLAGAR
jgi:transcriptional regulator with XRE-family HTH domain